LYTEVSWNIRLDHNRKAIHNVEIKIFDYASPPGTISLHFESHLQISDPQLRTKSKSVIGQQSQVSQSGPKIFSWLVNDIVKAYGLNPPNPLPAQINFLEENRILEFPDISIVNLHYGCGDLWARSVQVYVHLPKLGIFRYLLDWLILTIFRKKKPTGVYEITRGEGAHVHNWDIIKKGRSPILKFINKTHSSFPLASFSFRRAAKPIVYLCAAFIVGILTAMIGTYLYEKLFR
jgi:hypothetical protein